MSIYNSVNEMIGNTPLVKLNAVKKRETCATILLKLEYYNPGSSIKDRIAFSMILDAEKSGALKPGGTIVEPTSGNTGLGLAVIAATRGYKLIITMPETMSIERRQMLEHLGAEIILTSGELGMKGAVKEAEKISKTMKNTFMPQQFNNPANPLAHYKTTAPEIYADTNGKIDVFIAGVGTGGTLTGVGKYLKEKSGDIEIVAVEPANSAVISGEAPGKHAIQGIGAGFIPEVLNKDLISQVIKVSDTDALNTAKSLAKEEGILCGISSGANVYAALKLSCKLEYKNKTIVTVAPDTGERYLSTSLFQ